jgi:hypothetical protein
MFGKFKAPSPTNYQPTMQANGQAVNKGNLLSGLTRESAVNANTGTATGNQAVQDAAKSQLFAAQATMGRDIDKQNATAQAQRQQQREALTQQGRQQRLQRYQQSSQQAVSQMGLANQMQRDQIDLQSQWKLGLLNLIR